MHNYRRLLPLWVALLAPAALAGDIVLSDAWVRALPPVQKVTAGYLTVANKGSAAVTITGGSAELAQALEIHTTREVNGMTRMEPLQELVVPAGGSVKLSPGGTHLMLLGLERMPAPGESIELCLTSADGASACTSAEVRQGAPVHDHHSHH
mgnify:CR=1 FL=1